MNLIQLRFAVKLYRAPVAKLAQHPSSLSEPRILDDPDARHFAVAQNFSAHFAGSALSIFPLRSFPSMIVAFGALG